MVHYAHCRCCVLASKCLLAPSEALDRTKLRQIEFGKSEIIYSSTFPADAVFTVRSGSVSLTLVDRMGKPRIARFVRTGELFGLDSLLPTTTRVFSAIAREQTRLCFMCRTAFLDFMHQDQNRMWQLLLELNRLVHDNDLQKMSLSGQPARMRLLALTSRLGSGTDTVTTGEHVDIPIKQCELAQFLGVSEETVSRELKTIRAKHGSLNSLRV
jgi:CRP-like cAMP-binding protein